MRIDPRMGTGIVAGIYIILFLGIAKFLSVDLDSIELFFYISSFIIGFCSHVVFEKMNKNMKNDWRYTNQERYLHDKIFSLRKYDKPYPEHSHCEFCWIKFGAGGECQEGYTDENEDYWICPQCFEDFKELLLGE